MTGIDGLDTLLDETEGASLDVLLDRIAAAIPNGPDKRARISELVDESRAAWQWLLGGRRRGRILHLSGGWNASAVALARVWEQVVVLESSAGASRLLERKAAAHSLDNIEIVSFQEGAVLPFDDDTFDAVCWTAAPGRRTPCAAPEQGKNLDPFLNEAARVLRPDGELFLGLPNRWLRRRPFRSREPMTVGFGDIRRNLERAGLNVHSLFAYETYSDEQRHFVNLDDPGAVRAYLGGLKLRNRFMPTWLYRRTAPAFAVVAGTGRVRESWLEGALTAARAHVGADDDAWTTSPPAVNRKGKLLSILSRNGVPRWVIKIPLRRETREGMENAQCVLDALDTTLTQNDPLRRLLPRHAEVLDYAGMPLYMETACPGRPWSAEKRRSLRVWNTDFPDILHRLLELDADRLGLTPDPGQLTRRMSHLSQLLALHAPDLGGVLTAVEKRIAAVGDGSPARLRKGDMTLSNVFLDRGRVSGLIDWDETEMSSQPLASYADFIFSWLWQRENLSRAEGLIRLVRGDLSALPRSLAVRETISAMGYGPDDLAAAALASWVDHVHHEMKHPIYRFQPDRIESLLVRPCRALAPLLASR